jgi:hypothetical protein
VTYGEERPKGTETLLGYCDDTIYRSALGEIALEAEALFDRMEAAASLTWINMTMGWGSPRSRHSEQRDIGALTGALHLDAHSTEAHKNPTNFLHPNTNQLRYDLYAGTLAVQKLLPIVVEERPALLQALSEREPRQERWRTEPSEHHAELIADWRKWLRSDGIRRAPAGSELHGEASILAAASYQITMALNPGHDIHIGDEVDSLVFPVEREPWRH